MVDFADVNARNKKRPLGNRLARWLGATLALILARLIRRASLKTLRRLAPFLVCLGYPFTAQMRRKLHENLRDCLGSELSEAERRRFARALLTEYAFMVLLTLRLLHMQPDEVRRLVRVQGREHLDKALELGRGVVALGAHLGPFPLIGARLALDGYPYAVVVRMSSEPRLEAVMSKTRERMGVRSYYRGSYNRRVLEALRRGEIVHLFLDQHVARGGAVVEFFGHPAPTFTGPAVFARRLGCPVLPIFLLPDGPEAWVVDIGPPFDFAWTDDEAHDILHATQQLTRCIEDVVRRHPTQWAWVHRRWLRRTDRPKYILPELLDRVPEEVRQWYEQLPISSAVEPSRRTAGGD